MLRQRIFIVISVSIAVFMVLVLLTYFIAGIMSYKKTRDDSFGNGSIEVRAAEETGIDGNTVMQFVYHYADGVTEVYDSVPAKYMTGWGKQQLSSAYEKWTMDYYSPEKVVFHKNLDKNSAQHYILREYNGYVAVFYKDDEKIKEITSANILSMGDDERKRYAEGVEVVGNEELRKILQDLES
jgi:hypothetical protein